MIDSKQWMEQWHKTQTINQRIKKMNTSKKCLEKWCETETISDGSKALEKMDRSDSFALCISLLENLIPEFKKARDENFERIRSGKLTTDLIGLALHEMKDHEEAIEWSEKLVEYLWDRS